MWKALSRPSSVHSSHCGLPWFWLAGLCITDMVVLGALCAGRAVAIDGGGRDGGTAV